MDCSAVVMGEAVNNGVCDVPNTRVDSDNCLPWLRWRSHGSPAEAVAKLHHKEQVHCRLSPRRERHAARGGWLFFTAPFPSHPFERACPYITTSEQPGSPIFTRVNAV
jgi:hypothetical protein